jgi:hypothetical protein
VTGGGPSRSARAAPPDPARDRDGQSTGPAPFDSAGWESAGCHRTWRALMAPVVPVVQLTVASGTPTGGRTTTAATLSQVLHADPNHSYRTLGHRRDSCPLRYTRDHYSARAPALLVRI